MNKHPFLLVSTFLSALLLGGCSFSQPSSTELSVASWNIEHLASENGKGCKPRQASDYLALQQYASSLNVDIVALQEVESQAALERVFQPSEWQIIISNRANSPTYTCRGSNNTSTQQKVAFAVRKHLNITDVEYLSQFSELKLGLRQGLKITIAHQEEEVNLVNFHLKSGCFVSNYTQSDKESCRLFSKQAALLDDYLDTQSLQSENWILLGDFNHHLSQPGNYFRRKLFNEGQFKDTLLSNGTLKNVTDNKVSCHPKYPKPIDHILVSSALDRRSHIDAVQFVKFKTMKVDEMLSDHCALSARFTF